MVLISSPSNPRIVRLRDLHTARGRKKSGLFLMEGPHLLQSLLVADLLPQEIYYQPDLLRRQPEGRGLLKQVQAHLMDNQLIEVSERVIEALGDTQTSQGVICVLPIARFDAVSLKERRSHNQRPCLLILDALADPGNLGTILRTALAADVEEVLLTPRCVDCYSPKVVRAAAGTHVALPISPDMDWARIQKRVEQHCGEDFRVLVAEADGQRLYFQENLSQPFALVIGNEAHGPSQEARALATTRVQIPLANGVESLNAAMAAGIILYETVRQQQAPKTEETL